MRITYDPKQAAKLARAEAAEIKQKEVIAAYVKRAVDAWPPLTAEQRDKLAVLLRPAPGGPR